MSNLPLALVLGLLGSLHCAVMCGPIMLSLPLEKTNYLKLALHLLLYQLGRVIVYTLLGVLVGFVGSSFGIFGGQKLLSFILGICLLGIAILLFSGKNIRSLNSLQTKLVNPISKLMGRVYRLPLWGFYAGLLNGLIPCGMVYLALVTALSSASVIKSASFMLLFGVGTCPLMLMVSLGGVYLRSYIRFNPNRLLPWFMLFIGALFILRSSNLGVPFLSPDMGYHESGKVEVCK